MPEKKLKKLVVRIPVFPQYVEYFKLVEKYEIFQIHRLDDDNIFVTQKAKFKDPKMHPKDTVSEDLGIDFVEVLAEDKKKNEFIFFSKHHWNEWMKHFFDKLEIVLDPPIILENDKLIISFLTDNEEIDKLLDSQSEVYGDGDYEILSITPVHPNLENLFLKLTDRQREIAFYAVQNGYYDIPRKLTSEKLAEHFNISQSAVCEHLRKIEKKIFDSIFK